ncbi:MAG: hypothetical protein A2234_07500 [Elusimicrobia bacterium RIFOXYA2_FULL_58_8]|nr:MAG: hypothetical protein A2234_07500 [Elusimicrobia bacterium RIFOXYA2_FULL_58_8]OGS13714.1 MAG: hypothetical protein A2285_01265 [Elusimicrobia bacterium RIFOXYA12_FULL_57_11]
MPELTFGVIVFCSVSALAFAGAVLWFLGQQARAAHRHALPFSYIFLAGCITFSLVYFLNRLFFPLKPDVAAGVNIGLLAAIFSFPVLRRKFHTGGPE